MALTFSSEEVHVVGDLRMWLVAVNFDNSYPTGGEVLATTDFSGCSNIVYVLPSSADDARYRPVWVRSTGAVKLYIEDGTTGIEAEAANSSDQSAVNIDLLVLGK